MSRAARVSFARIAEVEWPFSPHDAPKEHRAPQGQGDPEHGLGLVRENQAVVQQGRALHHRGNGICYQLDVGRLGEGGPLSHGEGGRGRGAPRGEGHQRQ